jgi:23S rRNA (uridine2552-2'-O)-methyltransferase
VLDLGSAPGGWLQVVSEAIGEEGKIVGVDIDEIKLDLGNIETIIGDVNEAKTLEKIISKFPGRVDVVLSDLSPNISGTWELDQYRQIALSKRAMEISKKILKKNGWLIIKIFQGPEHESFIEELKEFFSQIKIIKPKASRKRSAEVYVVAKRSPE